MVGFHISQRVEPEQRFKSLHNVLNNGSNPYKDRRHIKALFG